MSAGKKIGDNVIKSFLLNDTNKERNGYIWNMLGSTLNAFQSVILLMVITRTIGLAEAGVYTFAFANANLFLNLGNFGMRNFQVSDVKRKYSFKEYLVSRFVSNIAMLVIAFFFIFYSAKHNGYPNEKVHIMIWMVLQKTVDSIENVYHGQYQRSDRLDVAGKCMTIRMIILIVSFGTTIYLSKSLLMGLVASTVISLVVFVMFTIWTNNSLTNDSLRLCHENTLSIVNLGRLMWSCLPLCIGAFLSFYIGNAPKYAIDALLSSESQACYGFIAMPVFVVGLLNNYIFMPQMYKLSNMWKNRDIKAFIKRIFIQIYILTFITLVCVIGTIVAGVPVLSWLYNTDLSNYKMPLVILILGGGFLGLTGFLSATITIVRFQKYMVYGYIMTSIIAFTFSSKVVELYEIPGAAMMYTGLMILLSLVFCVILVAGIKSNRQSIASLEIE